MAPLDLGEESEPNILNTLDVDKVFKYVVRWLRNKNTTRYFEDHPAARNTIVTAVQEVTQPKPLPTAALTSCNYNTPREQAPTALRSQHILQEEPGCDDEAPTPLASQHVAQEGEFDCADPADQHNLSGGHHNKSSPADQQEFEQGSRSLKPVYVEVADDSESEQSGGSQHSANLNGRPPADHGDDLFDQDARLNSQSLEQTATSLIQYESDTSQYPSRKRKHNFERRRDSKRPYIKAIDATEIELGSRSLQYSEPFEFRPVPNQDERHDQQPKISETSKDGRLSIAAITPPIPPETVVRSRYPSPEPPGVDLLDRGIDKFTMLSATLRAKLGRIANTATLTTIWDYLKNQRTPVGSADDCADASEQDTSLDTMSASDQRLRVLKTRIVRDEKVEKTVKYLGVAVRISKRVALAELIGRYIEEREARRAVPKKRRKKQLPRSSPKDRFTDLLFPETIKYKGEQLSKENGMQIKEKGPREKAKKKLNYWIQLGEPLARMAQRYGIGILLLLPEELTDKDLHSLPRPDIEDFLDYIDFVRPGLKEQATNLPAILLDIVDNRLPLQRLVLETLTSNLLPELRNRPLKELFQFASDAVHSEEAEALIGPSSNQMYANNQLSQGTIESAQSTRLDCTSKSLRWQSPGAIIQDQNPSNFRADCGEYTLASESQGRSAYLRRLNQQFNMYLEDPFYFEGADSSAQQQSTHCGGEFPDPQDFCFQNVNWSAQQQSGYGGVEYAQDGNSLAQEQSGHDDAESAYFDSLINYSPQSTPGIASPISRSEFVSAPYGYASSLNATAIPSASTHLSTLASKPDINSPALVDT